jgi:hypothetical protein
MGRVLEIAKALLCKARGKHTAVDTAAPNMGSDSVADSKSALLAVKWLQKAFQTLERGGDGKNTNLAVLRVSPHPSLSAWSIEIRSRKPYCAPSVSWNTIFV